MVQIIVGEKGKGKTKILLDKANTDIKSAKGSVVYLDKNNQHMYELDRNVRLINVTDYCIECASEFVGFICGILSQDHDVEKIYLDSFLKVACLNAADVDRIIEKLSVISEKFNADIIISLSQKSEEISAVVKEKVIAAL